MDREVESGNSGQQRSRSPKDPRVASLERGTEVSILFSRVICITAELLLLRMHSAWLLDVTLISKKQVISIMGRSPELFSNSGEVDSVALTTIC